MWPILMDIGLCLRKNAKLGEAYPCEVMMKETHTDDLENVFVMISLLKSSPSTG